MRFVFKPLLLVVTALNVFVFVFLFGHRGEGRPMLAAYLPQQSSTYRLGELSLLQRVVTRIGTDYVDPDRVKPSVMLEKSFEQVQRFVPELMFEPSEDKRSLTVVVGTQKTTLQTRPVETLGDLVDVLKASLSYAEPLIAPEIKLEEVEYAAINGILSTLDPHSVLMPPEVAREMDVQIQGEFGGLGITISLRGDDNLLTIISTLPDTPAARAGLKPGDQIQQIEDESTVNMSLTEAVSKLRGLVGTPVTILVKRKEWEQPRPMRIRRETIRIESAVASMLGDGVGYVHIKAFQHTTSRDLSAALKTFKDSSGTLKGLVLDLRGNPGGPLEQAIEVSDRFLESGVIVETVRALGLDSEERRATMRGTEEQYPVVVILNAESASASEIVAGALQNLDRGVVIGDQSFGKGSVQNLYPHPNDTKLKLTIAKYLTPGHRSIQSIGIMPDIQLLPVYFDQKHTLFYSSAGALREKDLDSHFDETEDASRMEKPQEVIRYYSPKDFELPPADEDAEEAANKARSEEIEPPKKPDPLDDWQVRFARDLILKAGKSTRRATLNGARTFIRSAREAQDAEIQTQLANLNVDWSVGKSAGAGATLSAALTLSGSTPVSEPASRLSAGEKVTLTLTVTNSGQAPVHRVRALSSCEVGSFSDLELLFGKLEPGQSRTLTREIKLPPNLYSLVEPVTFAVFENAEHKVQETTALLTVEARPSPAFAYNLVVVDDGTGTSRGNGDGLIQRGEQIDLVIMMKNFGMGEASKAFAKLAEPNSRHVYLRRGTANLKKVSSGAWVEGRFQFEVREGLPEDRISFDLLAGDALMLRRPTDKLVFQVEPSPVAVEKSASLVAVGGEMLLMRSAPSPDATVFAEVVPGAVVQATGLTSGWVRVEAPFEHGSLNGWVPAAQVKEVSNRTLTPNAFVPVFNRVPPRIALETTAQHLPTTTSSFPLRGTISDEGGVSLVYAFVNNKKRMLRSFTPAQLTTDAHGYRTVRLDVSIPLEEGSNTIEVYARDDEKLQALEVFQVYRDKPAAQTAMQ